MKVDNFSCFDPTMKLYGNRIKKIRVRSKRIKERKLRNRSYKKQRACSLSYDPIYGLFSDILNGDIPIIGSSRQNQKHIDPLSRKSVSTGGRPIFYASRNTNVM